MRERKCVKLKVNMYEDTKFKIIDRKPERDLIHYIWTRFITLAGKVNLEGGLYMSKNIPYTIETLAIEFNRGAYQVKLALDVFMELEMIELTEDNVYRVKNFAKHQNIKVKEKIKSKDEEENIKIKEVQIKENIKNEIYNNGHKQSENKISKMYDNEDEGTKNKINEIYHNETEESKNRGSEIYHNQDEEFKNKTSENKVEIVKNNECDNLEIENKATKKIKNRDTSKIKDRGIIKIGNKNIKNIGQNIDNDKNYENIDDNIKDEKNNNNLQDNIPIGIEIKNKKKVNNKKNTINCYDIEEENEDNSIVEFFEGDEGRPLKEGECVIGDWSF